MDNTRRILVVGSINVDLVTRVERSPRVGETILGRSFSTVSGGKGANQAVGAARLGGQVAMAACVGGDDFGRQQLEGLQREGVDTAHVLVSPSEPTGTAVILVADNGESTIVVVPSANFCLTERDVAALRPQFSQADAVLLQFEIPLPTVEAALRLARDCGTLSVLDAGPARKVPSQLLALADVVSPNETEAETLTGISVETMEGARNAARELLAMGAGHVVLKLGARGSLWAGTDGEIHAPAFPVKVVDTTAAGDAFTAALALRWNPRNMRDTLEYANAAGALAAMGAGAQPSMPRAADVERFLAERRGA